MPLWNGLSRLKEIYIILHNYVLTKDDHYLQFFDYYLGFHHPSLFLGMLLTTNLLYNKLPMDFVLIIETAAKPSKLNQLVAMDAAVGIKF